MARPLPSPGLNGDRSRSGSWQEQTTAWGRRLLVGVTSVLATYLGGCVVALGLYSTVFPPITGVQLQRRVEAALSGARPEQRYAPVPLSRMDPALPLAVVAGEDSRFFRHWGIDWKEVGKAIQAYRHGENLRGASSITQQLVKNLFLTTHSTVFRKAMEVPLTYAAELLLSKRRILELYLNVIEWGPGVYGAQAATTHHYGASARHLTRSQAAALAACIPNPLGRRPQTVGSYRHVILQRMNVLDPLPLSLSPAAPNVLQPSPIPSRSHALRAKRLPGATGTSSPVSLFPVSSFPMIDLRSDTVTRPTEGMRRAMYEAEVGDDVYGEDPTVNRLQKRVADRLGTEDALFVPSGTMANQICLHVLTEPGDEVILERGAHIFNYETGAAGLLSGLQLHPLDGTNGLLSSDQVEAAIRPDAVVSPRTRVVSVENTANKAGGVVYPLDRIEAIAETARSHDLHLHLDGARLWNAAEAHDVPESRYAAAFDLTWVALSKGLGAPVGSLVAGPAPLIDEARRARKRFGGGMRQAGILAAAGLYALEHHRPHLGDDHAKAQRLAETIAALPAFELDVDAVETNIIIFEVTDGTAESVVGTLEDEGVLVTPFGPTTVRATTHRDVSMAEVETTATIIREQFSS